MDAKSCLTCKHRTFNEGVFCNHPARPNAPSPVVRWYPGCPQHEPNNPQPANP